jgi:2-keto-4-pentenoate hydratase/2-oxohepta-3-ene-1,7-dioic acid hydratase in catechol pathway
MREVRFRDAAGHVRQGEWTDEGIDYYDRTYDVADVDVLPPTEPTKVVCLAANYLEHMKESPRRSVPADVPDRPELFLKGPNAVAGHGDTITLPTPGTERDEWSGEKRRRIDHEAELGVVVGTQCRNVAEDEVEDVIRGFTCVNDLSNRNDQMVEQNWVRGKSFDGAAPMGPVVASPDLVPDNPRIRCRVNGETRQDSADDEFVFSVPEAVAEITKFLTLEPGDVVAMGTTYGVDRLTDGDEVEIEIEGIGTLQHSVSAD